MKLSVKRVYKLDDDYKNIFDEISRLQRDVFELLFSICILLIIII